MIAYGLGLTLLIAGGLVDMPRMHQALGLADDHTHVRSDLARRCDAACGRRRVFSADLPGGPIADEH